MNPEQVTSLIAQGEKFTVEFKRATSKSVLNDRELVETVVCMANGAGGHVLLGVEDDGSVTGAGPRHDGRTDPDLLSALVLNRTDPPLAVGVSVIPVDDVEVVVIDVPDAPSVVGTKDGVFKRRATRVDGSPECIPYRPHDMLSAGFSLTGRDYAAVPAREATLADLDPAEFDRLRRLAATSGGDSVLQAASDTEICRALRVLDGEGEVTLGAVLLFGRPQALERYVPSAECLFQELDGGRIKTNESRRVPLLRAAEELYALLDARNTEDEVMVGLHRLGIPRIPRSTLREAIANALVHRDYAELGPITVQLTEDEFRTSSPGGFPPGISLLNLMDLSRPRSVILADAFKRAGIVDRAGRGIHEMYESLLRAGRGGPDFNRSTDRSVTVVVPTSGSDLDIVRFIVSFEADQRTTLTFNQLRLLHAIKTIGSASVSELSAELSLDVQKVRTTASRLLELGLLEVRGGGRNRRYHLTAAFYRVAEDRNAYVRVRAADPIQQDQMVLSYVDAYGTITRGQVATLCMLGPDQARAVLKRLTASGKLVMRGERRGAHYVPPDAP